MGYGRCGGDGGVGWLLTKKFIAGVDESRFFNDHCHLK